MKAATGTERISLDIGLVRILNAVLFPERRPQTRPEITAKTNPLIMFPSETPTAFQKNSFVAQLKSSFTASKGRGIANKRLRLAKLAAICHSRTQKKMDPAEKTAFLKLTFIIETVFG